MAVISETKTELVHRKISVKNKNETKKEIESEEITEDQGEILMIYYETLSKMC